MPGLLNLFAPASLKYRIKKPTSCSPANSFSLSMIGSQTLVVEINSVFAPKAPVSKLSSKEPVKFSITVSVGRLIPFGSYISATSGLSKFNCLPPHTPQTVLN